ncbi:DUF3993 domain-containing protein [Schinkia azotoformans]|uniref:DUF3993 domain-containing protein n=1 Tax=Schinkia azotoformans TaxID=1454 RepID=UPI002E1B6878|nr:DUF3993 domain-containing protein [Schinkia azotoformans]
MRVKIWALLLLLLIGQVHFISAENVSMTREETFLFLQEALSAQLSLGDKFRSEQEISDVLSPYFTEDYQKLFVAEHIFSEPEGFIMYGTDVFDYFIPMYSYDVNTKIMTDKNKIIVTEYFLPQLEGPVVWEKPHYESITIIKTKAGWKISDYLVSEDKPSIK